MVTRGSHEHKPMVNFLGGLEFCWCCKFLKILMVSDKTIHKALRIHKKSMNKTHNRNFWFFTIYQNNKLALSLKNTHISLPCEDGHWRFSDLLNFSPSYVSHSFNSLSYSYTSEFHSLLTFSLISFSTGAESYLSESNVLSTCMSVILTCDDLDVEFIYLLFA